MPARENDADCEREKDWPREKDCGSAPAWEKDCLVS